MQRRFGVIIAVALVSGLAVFAAQGQQKTVHFESFCHIYPEQVTLSHTDTIQLHGTITSPDNDAPITDITRTLHHTNNTLTININAQTSKVTESCGYLHNGTPTVHQANYTTNISIHRTDIQTLRILHDGNPVTAINLTDN